MRKIVIIILLLNYIQLFAQSNRVLNPSFEDYIDTSTNGIQGAAAFLRNLVNYWSDPISSTSDLYTYKSYQDDTSYPNIIGIGTFQYPHTGNTFAGFGIFGLSSSFREFVQASFMDSLIFNKTYAIKYFVALHDYSHCITDIGF